MTDQEVEKIIQFRSIRVMCHELGHMFGMKHCTYYKCIMNGSNYLEESNKKPWYLWWICLRKLYKIIRFDLLKRYQSLAEAWNINPEFNQAKKWYQNIANDLAKIYKNEQCTEPIVPKYPILGNE